MSLFGLFLFPAPTRLPYRHKQAARDGQPSRLIAVFQPHRYSRTRDLLGEFGPALSAADHVILTDIYAAGESPVEGASLPLLERAVREAVPALDVVPALGDIPGAVARLAKPGDVVVTLGAGSISGVGRLVLAALESAEVRT